METDKEITEDRNVEISKNEIEEWEKMGIDLESVCQNFNLNFKKNENLNTENTKSVDERISELSHLLKQLYDYQEIRKNRNYYQTEISVEEKELGNYIIFLYMIL